MTDTQKKTIDAKEILKDIRSGADESQIKRKFGLSDKGYLSVMAKLREKGLLKNTTDERPSHTRARNSAQNETPVISKWTCPACGTSQNQVYDECPKCGIVAKKLSALSHPPPYHDSRRSGHSIEEDRPEHKSNIGVVLLIIGIAASVVIGALVMKSGSGKKVAGSASSGPVQNFTTANFDLEVREKSKSMPVLVMFYADW